MTNLQEQLVYWCYYFSEDNTYHYYNKDAGESNLGPYTFDCATFNSFTFYKAMGWDTFPDTSKGGIGYFWPWINEGGFDYFLTFNGWARYAFSEDLLTEGAIIITDTTLHHSLMYVGNRVICDANNYFGYGDDSINVRPYPTYDTSKFKYIYLPPNVSPGPTPKKTGIPLWMYFAKRKRRPHV